MLRITNLNKTYGSGIRALRDVSLSVPAGMFGLLGPNGAGKTTLMKILATLLAPNSGAVAFDELDLLKEPMSVRRSLGYLPQDFGFYPTFTAEQMLSYLALLKGVADKKERRALIGALLEKVNLVDARNQRVGTFSGGMRQRLGIAQALIGQPKLLIVDEPTAGLDPEERVRFHNSLSEVASDNAVVILSTHIVADVANLCGQLAIIRQGEIIATDAPEAALARLSGSVWEATVEREQFAVLKPSLQVLTSQSVGDRVRVRAFARRTAPAENFQPAAPTLDDFYLIAIGGKELSD